ncbi:MAG: hypothetical protein LQ350_007806 [Teloschistes chrysophthalmus]|nr:MAG: hypothetical protein LQ350_007806 [Niorma chrysophthalma]
MSTVPVWKRPSIAPKPVLNTKHIRENPDLYQQTCIDRNYRDQQDNPRKIVRLHYQLVQLQRNARDLRQLRNIVRTKLASAPLPDDVSGTDTDSKGDRLLAEAKQLKEQFSKVEVQEDDLRERIETLAIDLPNLTSTETPIGREPRVLGYINNFSNAGQPSAARNHTYIGKQFDILDFEAAGTTSGWGWYFLKNEGALLEQALVQYALSVAMKHGFSMVTPPSMVYSHIAGACGFQPRDQGGEQQSYVIAQQQRRASLEQEGKPEMVMAGTAEILFAGMKANTTLEARRLPLKVVGASRCYRAEAGARGSDTKGLYRVHEFTKVEMFAWTLKDEEQAVFNAMLAVQKEILGGLGLNCRILEMPSTDLGASAVRKIDIETFFPSRQLRGEGWGEVTSASICTDYQTRRLNTRVKSDTAKAEKEITPGPKATVQSSDFPSTINGTAMAVPRVIAALLENRWNEKDDYVQVPEVLQYWMHGKTHIRKKDT